jgi:DNA-binding MarR family transcriptional regulator
MPVSSIADSASPGKSSWVVSSLPWFLLNTEAASIEDRSRQQQVNELLGSAHLFVSAVSGTMEQQLLTEVAGKQLSVSQLKILKLLDLTEAHNVGDVAAFLGVSDAAASKSVDRLVRRKYLRRAEGRPDRRSSVLSLAAAGRTVLKRYEAAKDRKLAAMFGNLDAAELQQTTAFLERLTMGIVHESANPEEICLQCGIYLNKKRCLVREAGQPDCNYQRRKVKRQARSDATRTAVSARGGSGVGPPG